VTQANIRSTICRAGWSTKERERYLPGSRAATVKRRMLVVYGKYAGPSLASYELDHLVPISLGGSPDDPGNLWVEAPPSPNPKDRVEWWALTEVCAGRVTLAAAQAAMVGDWRQLEAATPAQWSR
jgi:5-methylcytosine-specific restriction endonuclease McrA